MGLSLRLVLLVVWFSVLTLPRSAAAQVRADREGEIRAAAQTAFSAREWEEAVRHYRALLQIDEKDGVAWQNLGYALHTLGRHDEALDVHLHVVESFPARRGTAVFNVACVQALRGETREALDWLERAIQTGSISLRSLATDADLDSLRGEPRFAQMVESLAVTEVSPKSYVQNKQRGYFRLSFWGKGGACAQVVMHYGRPAWKEAYARAIDAPANGTQHWRLGQNFWTTLDTSVPLTLGGVPVAAGYYYVTLRARDGDIRLVLHEPSEIYRRRTDASDVASLRGGLEIPLHDEPSATFAESLEIDVVMDQQRELTGHDLVLRFGPYQLYTSLDAHANWTGQESRSP